MIGSRFFAALDSLPLATLDQVAGEGGLMVIAPHQDDETLGCGGFIAEAVSRQRDVRIVIVSDGAGSHRRSIKFPPERLKEIRRRESVAALGILGVKEQDIYFLDQEDGAVPATGGAAMELARQILAIARSIDTRTMLVTWRDDPHPDHQACYAIARQVQLWQPQSRVLEYPVWGAYLRENAEIAAFPRGYRLDIAIHVDRKRQAMSQYRSQLTDMIDDAPEAKPLPAAMLERFGRPYEVFIELPRRGRQSWTASRWAAGRHRLIETARTIPGFGRRYLGSLQSE